MFGRRPLDPDSPLSSSASEMAGTTCSEGVVLPRPNLLPHPNPFLHRSLKPLRRLQSQAPVRCPGVNLRQVSATHKKVPIKKASNKQCVAQPTTPKELVPLPTVNPLPSKISHLPDTLPINACIELTRRLLTTVTSLPSGPTSSKAVLKVVLLFVAEYGSTA
jgi:hypothetical protein